MRSVALLAAALLVACGEPAPAPPSTPTSDGSEAAGSGAPSLTYEQSFVFAAVNGDSAFFVPWILRTTARPD